MSNLIINANSIYDRVIRIGRQTENLVSSITFNLNMWIEEYGAGECVLNVRRNGDGSAYPVPMTIADGMATWTITDTDTAKKGRGEVQLVYRAGDKVKTSPIFTISCGESLVGGEVPEPYEEWLTELKRMTAQVEAAKTSASASAQTAQTAANTATEKATEAAQSATMASASAQAAIDENAAAVTDINGRLGELSTKIIPSKNLLNTENNTLDSYIKQTTGVLTPYTGWQASEYIPIEPNTVYKYINWSSARWSAPANVYFAFYDANKVYTHGAYTSSSGDRDITSVAGDAYVRVSTQNAVMSTNKPMFGKASDIGDIIGSTDTNDYIAYGNTLVKNTLKAKFDSYVASNDSAISSINDNMKSVSIILPSTVYIAVGRQVTFYKPNYLRCKNPDDYVCYWSTSLANTTFDEHIRFEPTTIGTYTAQLFIMNRYTRETVAQKTITIEVVADTVRTNKKVLFIGDSLTNAGFYPYEIQKHLSGEGVESIGTVTTTAYLDSDPAVTTKVSVQHEGRGGWSAQDYISKASKSGVTNAFWNPNTASFDFAFYLSNNGFSLPDIVFINLGTNGTVNPQAEINAIKTIITSIRAYSATVPIVVSAIAPGNATQNRYVDIYLTQIRELQIAEFDGTMSNVWVAPIYLNINRETDWKTQVVAESSRNTLEVTRQIDSVHPSKYGYFKFADVYWSVIQKILG